MPKIFISYRRVDSAAIAGRLFDRLQAHFGHGAVFIDVDSIPFGVDFRTHLADAVSKCDALLAIIGDKWADADQDGHARLSDPKDFVCIEIEAALDRNIPVIPVLIGKTPMPHEEELPSSLRQLAYRNACNLDSGPLFHAQVDRLIHGLDQFGAQMNDSLISPASGGGSGGEVGSGPAQGTPCQLAKKVLFVEYLYVDQRRLQGYFEQFQPRSSRSFTDHERVTKLLQKIQPRCFGGSDRGIQSEFILGTLNARRVVLPKSLSRRAEFTGLAIWVSPASESTPFVALIEDYQGKDEEGVRRWSGNSTLNLLFSELKSDMPDADGPSGAAEPKAQEFNVCCNEGEIEYHTSRPLLVEALRRSGVPDAENLVVARFSNYASRLHFNLHIGTHRCEADVEKPINFRPGDAVIVTLVRDRAAEVAGKFVEDPFGLVRDWGGDIGPDRQIDTLFRLRHTLIERDARNSPTAVIGYPIFVAQHPSGLVPGAR